jgi:hypothetical protein
MRPKQIRQREENPRKRKDLQFLHDDLALFTDTKQPRTIWFGVSILRRPWVGRAWASGRLPAPSGAVRGVRGAAGAMGQEADKAAGWRRASIFLLARRQPCRLRRGPSFGQGWQKETIESRIIVFYRILFTFALEGKRVYEFAPFSLLKPS